MVTEAGVAIMMVPETEPLGWMMVNIVGSVITSLPVNNTVEVTYAGRTDGGVPMKTVPGRVPLGGIVVRGVGPVMKL